MRSRVCVPVLTIVLVSAAAPAWAYIGPGAGFALVSSFVTLFIAFAAGALALFTFPARAAIRHWKRRRSLRRARVRKVIILGLDGLDPDRCEMLMARGELPHLSRLQKDGSYRRLGTTMPALSPVAWSTFATGVDPSRHGIFDFIHRPSFTNRDIINSCYNFFHTWNLTDVFQRNRIRFSIPAKTHFHN
jgi:hypothetical protein